MAIDHKFGVTLVRLDRDSHADQTFLWRNDVRIRKWCRQNDVLFRSAHNAWFERQAADPRIQMYAIQCDDRLVGVCGLTDVDLVNRRAEFSLYVGPEHQGQGLARAALKTLFTHGFMAYGLNCIWGESFDGNPAMRLFVSLGMQREGVRRDHYYRDGRFIDCQLFSILRSDWDRLLPLWRTPNTTTIHAAEGLRAGDLVLGDGTVARGAERAPEVHPKAERRHSGVARRAGKIARTRRPVASKTQ